MGIQLDRITSARDPDAAGAFLRDQFRPHHGAPASFWWRSSCGRRLRLGRSHRGENPFYNEEWTESAWLILRDYVAPRVLHHNFECAADVGARTRAHPRPPDGARRTGSRGLGSGSAHARPAALPAHRRRRAARDSLRRLHRHSGFGPAAAREDRNRTRRRLPAHQDEDQAGLGRRSGPRSAQADSPTFC